ncbi:MAG: Mrp/NBP35 family ATP-binding protein [Thermoguttaceae bacterium]
MTDTTLTETTLQAALARFQDPETGRSITTLGQVHSCQLDGAKVSITLGLTSWSAPLWEAVRAELENDLKRQFPAAAVTVAVAEHQRPAEKMGTVGLAAKSVLAVGSGKGGVGKSSIAVFLAAALARAGCKVGLLDADVYGPSIPHLLGTTERPQAIDERIEPVEVAGMKLMSIGLLVPAGEAVIWRGPMLHGALTQFLRDTAWGELDYLIVDMPPGTGDVALSLAQLLPQAGAVVVCTPQDVALLDAVKAIAMFRTVNLSLFGMVENMSFFVCPHCGAREDIFGAGGAKRRAAELEVPFLGEVPLLKELRVMADEGRLAAALDYPPARPYLEAICQALVGGLAARRRASPRLPTLPVLE